MGTEAYRAALAEIDQELAHLLALLGEGAGGAAAPSLSAGTVAPPRPSSASPGSPLAQQQILALQGSLGQRILATLQAAPDGTMAPGELRMRVGGPSVYVLQRALEALVNAKVVKVTGVTNNRRVSLVQP